MTRLRAFSMKAAAVILVCVVCVMCTMALAGCSDKGITGHWVLAKEKYDDGNEISGEEIEAMGMGEELIISENNVRYILRGSEEGDITIDMTYANDGDGNFDFMIEDFEFAKAHREGKYLVVIIATESEVISEYFTRVKD